MTSLDLPKPPKIWLLRTEPVRSAKSAIFPVPTGEPFKVRERSTVLTPNFPNSESAETFTL